MFYHFRQKNNGGYFDRTADLDTHVIIEADSAEDANERAESIGLYFDFRAGDCEHCGYRWHEVSEYNGEDFPHCHGTPVEEYDRFYGSAAIVHYANGAVSRFTKASQ